MSKGKGGQSYVTGYRYFFDILMGLGRGPVDSLVDVRVGDVTLVTPDVTGNTNLTINQPSLFGGDTGEGGIVGTLSVLFGGSGQIVPGDIKNRIAGLSGGINYSYGSGGGTTAATQDNPDAFPVDEISDFRGAATLFYTGQVCANNPYPKTWKMRVRRALQGWGKQGVWYPEKAPIVYTDANKGGWDAHTNTPQLLNGIGAEGDAWGVTTAGLTVIDGVGNWLAGQQAFFTKGKWTKRVGNINTIVSMNPVHILYQCLTNVSWGRGMSRDELDLDSWVYAANYLFSENFGLCLRWAREQDINDFIQNVIDHIGAALYIDRGSGLMVLRLIRGDYTAEDLPYFDYTSGLLSVDTQDTGTALVTSNEIVVNWHDPVKDEDRQVRVQNSAAIQATGAVISQTRDYPGICNADVATRVALRELNVGAAGLKRFKAKFDRRAWRIQPGMVIKISAPDKGIASVIARVATYDDGTAIDGTITMDCLQDVFGLPSTVYVDPVPPLWQGPIQGTAPPLTREFIQEGSYFEAARGLPNAQVDALSAVDAAILGAAGRPSSNSRSLLMVATPTGGTAIDTSGAFCPTGVTAGAIDFYTNTINLSGGTNLDQVAANTTAVIDVELIRITGFDVATGVVTFERGGADTIPAQHPAGSIIFFHNVVNSVAAGPFVLSDVLDVYMMARTTTGTSAIVTHHAMTIVARQNKPYVMGDLKLNGVPALSTSYTVVRGDAVFTWAARNRQLQYDQFVAHDDGAVTAEAGTTYTVEVRNGITNALRRTHSGITASTYTYNAAESALGDPPNLRLVFYTVRSGVVSYSQYNVLMQWVGDGMGIAVMAGHGTATFVSQVLRAGAMNAHGQGLLAAVNSGTTPSIGVLTASGTGTLNAVSRSLGPIEGTAVMAGTGELNAVSEVVIEATATMTGTGTLTAMVPAGYGEGYGFDYGGTT